MKSKKGFTLIEIIVSITLIAIVGTSIAILSIYSNKKNEKTLATYTERIHQAVNVYLNSNKDAYNQVYNNKNGALITLKTLENEGLIEFDNNVNIDNEYVVAMVGSSNPDSACVNGTQLIDSWNASTKNTIYICLDTSKINNGSSDLKEKLLGEDGYYIARGSNPNNWVEFPVTSDSSQNVYFQNDSEQNLWRILSIDNDGSIKLIYNKNVDGKDEYKIWSYNDILGNTDKLSLLESKLNILYVDSSYYGYYYRDEVYQYQADDLYKSYYGIIGTINTNEYANSFINNKTWIDLDDEIIIGYNLAILQAKNDTMVLSNKRVDTHYDGNGASFRPVVTLKSSVKLTNNNCSDKLGSKGCPYKLECSDCAN